MTISYEEEQSGFMWFYVVRVLLLSSEIRSSLP